MNIPGYREQRRSILVRASVYQEGPKNPLKGISLKPVVPALNASLGWVLGGSAFLRLLRQGGLQWHGVSVPLRSGDPVLCIWRTPLRLSRMYGPGLNL